MKDKKVVILIVLSLAALASLLYGIMASSKGRKRAAITAQQSGGSAAASVVFAPRQARRSVYQSWGRDPFSLPSTSVKKYKGLVLNGIMWDSDKPMAIINERIVESGANISGNVIVEIKEDRVILNDGVKDFELILK